MISLVFVKIYLTKIRSFLYFYFIYLFLYHCITVRKLLASALVSFGALSGENKMVCQSLFSITAGILAMFCGFDSHFVVLWLWLFLTLSPLPISLRPSYSELLLRFQGQDLLRMPAGWERLRLLPWWGESRRQREYKRTGFKSVNPEINH